MIETRIMDVPKRKAFVDRLARQLGLSAKDIVLDTRGENGGGECWTTCKQTLQSLYASGASHGIVCQGDVRVCNDFYVYAEKCRSFNPDAIWSFCWWGRFHNVVKEKYDTPYIRVLGGHFTTQCYMLPLQRIPEMLSEIDLIYGEDPIYDDALRLVWYAMKNQIPVYITVPSLAQHLVREVPSTFGFNKNSDKTPRYNRFYTDDVSWANWDAKHEDHVRIFPFRHVRKNRFDYAKVNSYCDIAEKLERETIDRYKNYGSPRTKARSGID